MSPAQKAGAPHRMAGKHDRRAHGRLEVCQARFDDGAVVQNGILERAGKAVTTVADLLLREFMDKGIRPNYLDRIAIDQDLHGELPGQIVGVHHESGKRQLAGTIKCRSYLPNGRGSR